MHKWLDKKVLGFKQDLRSFINSKTNQAAIATIIGASIACVMDQITVIEAANLIVPAVIGLCVRDTVAGAKA